jgi:23S rRNA (cytosine1962-C5)-methyltransferase
MNYPILQLLPKRDRSVLNRHPWIFSGALRNPVKATEGAIVEVRSNEGMVLGYGFFSKESQIVCRMFEWSDTPGPFETIEYWQKKIANALSIRKPILINNDTNTFRLLHAEGDFIPGIIADVYGEAVVLQILIEGIEIIKELLVKALANLNFHSIYVKVKSNAHLTASQRSSYWLAGHLEAPAMVKENGLNFSVDFINGQKTGFFIDQRDNRQLLRKYAKDKKVLIAFCYTGGFSVYALAGGATEVHSLDISNDAVNTADLNVRLNGLCGIHEAISGDCFNYLKEMPSDFYDIIVLDPPAFAKHSRAVDNAAKGYKQINMKAIEKIRTGGLIFTFSCSQHISKDLFQKIIFGSAADVKRNVRIIEQLHQPADHPINIYHPEGEYLKGLVLWVE